jgi:murein DD-endopeptidase MepM/ murein hydrolase activator NlpD
MGTGENYESAPIGEQAMRPLSLGTIVIAACLGFPASGLACEPGILKFPITDIGKTFIRKGNGEWGAPRPGDKPHGGVDIVVNASYPDNAPYAVFPIASGVVAYSRLNGTETTGYGNTVVVDHENNCYSLYAHLASSPFTPIKPGGNLLRKLGEPVQALDPIGYFVDIKADVDSTGNARSTAPEARHQVHFELIDAPSGRKGSGRLLDVIFKNDGMRIDPTPVLRGLGYQIR